MFDFLRAILLPPVFADDEDKTRVARHTHFITLFIIVFIFLYEAWIKFNTRRPVNKFDLAILAVLILFITIWVLLKSGMVRTASILLVSVLWVAANIIPALGYGIHDSSFMANFVVVIIANLLIGWQAGFAFGFLTALSAFGLVYLEQNGYLAPVPAYPPTLFAQDMTIMILLAVFCLYFLSNSLMTSLRRTRNVLKELSTKNKEMEQIQSSLQAHSIRLDELNRINLTRATQLRSVIQIDRDIASVRDVGNLLNLAANLIREQFAYYHVGIFLKDDQGEHIILRAASGTAARELLEQGFKFKIDDSGIVGSVARSGLPQIAQGLEIESIHSRNPLLPETRSEVGLPLRIRGGVIGVLDIHALEPAAFTEENIEVLQLLTDQVVAAVENVELLQRLETTLAELNTIYQSQTRLAWKKSIREHGGTSLEYDGLQIKPIVDQLPANVIQQLRTGKSLVWEEHHDGPADQKKHGHNTLLIPLMVLNQMVGAIGLQQEKSNHGWTEEQIALAEAVANRAALALENARLLEAAQRSASKERTISEISAKIGSLIDIDNIVQTAIQELSQTIPGTEVAIQFHRK